MSPSHSITSGRAAVRLSVRGVVQGVGFRPFVYSLAQRHALTGWVRNTSAGVEVLAEGAPADVDAFVEALPREAPPRSHIAAFERSGAEPEGAMAFRILGSAVDPDAYQLVSPDIATCDDCRAELFDPRDRRYQYPFTNCTNCGPRFTIIEDLPYDRERTTMRRFPLCPACRAEYEDPTDRRFHAEPNACPVCGPRVRLVRRAEGGAEDGPGGGVVELADVGDGPLAGPVLREVRPAVCQRGLGDHEVDRQASHTGPGVREPLSPGHAGLIASDEELGESLSLERAAPAGVVSACGHVCPPLVGHPGRRAPPVVRNAGALAYTCGRWSFGRFG